MRLLIDVVPEICIKIKIIKIITIPNYCNDWIIIKYTLWTITIRSGCTVYDWSVHWDR